MKLAPCGRIRMRSTLQVCQVGPKKIPLYPLNQSPCWEAFPKMWQYCDLSHMRSKQEPNSASRLVFLAHLLNGDACLLGPFCFGLKANRKRQLFSLMYFLYRHKGNLVHLKEQRWENKSEIVISPTVHLEIAPYKRRTHYAFTSRSKESKRSCTLHSLSC